MHIITSNPVILDRLRDQGFRDGVKGPLKSLGHISELSVMLLSVFDSGEDADVENLDLPDGQVNAGPNE